MRVQIHQKYRIYKWGCVIIHLILYPEKSIDMPQVNDKLLSHNAVLTTSHLGNQTHIFRSDRHGLYR